MLGVVKPRTSNVRVIRVEPDPNHPEFQTLQHLGYQGTSPPGTVVETLAVLFDILQHQRNLGTRYALPFALVTADSPCPEFIERATREQRRSWCWWNSALGSSSRVKRHHRSLDPLSRQLL